MMKTTVRIGGVPEHFNYSWHKLMEEGSLQSKGIEIQWKDYAGGTGAMAESFHQGELDIAIMLTEGAVAAIAKGCPARIAHFAVDSPLVWGIHTGSKSTLKKEEDMKGKTFAISRYGSGSHLMAIVHACQMGWPIEHMKWLEVKNLEGAKQALVNGDADVFLWERYTTKPLVDEGFFRLIGLLPTPWPAFVMVVSNNFIERHPSLLSAISTEILNVQGQLKASSVLSGTLAQRYKLQEMDIIQWLEQTIWSSSPLITNSDIESVGEALVSANVLTNSPEPEFILL